MSEQEGEFDRAREAAAVIRELKLRIDDGFTLEAFITSDVGRFLCTLADREREALVEQLVECDPDNAPMNRALRLRIAVLDKWQQWIGDAIDDGKNAQDQFIAIQ